jgi:lipoate-protein ligase B
MKLLELRQPGRIPYAQALELQKQLEARRKAGAIPDQLLLLEHPHVITMGRNAHDENVLLPSDRLAELGIQLVETNRGGDVTYHGPGQIVGYPVIDLREWKRDVVAYVRGVEEVILRTLAVFGVKGERDAGATGVWARRADGELAKVCAIGVHISRWVTSHGFALNWTTDLRYFGYIVPCGLTRPVTSLEELGVRVERAALHAAIAAEFAAVFGFDQVIAQNGIAGRKNGEY